jgi:hypothetical protein
MKVTDIEIDEGVVNELKNKPGISEQHRKYLMRRYSGGGGACCICGQFPTKQVSYDISDSDLKAQRIERYCRNCWEKNKVNLLSTNGKDKTMAVRDDKILSRVEYK